MSRLRRHRFKISLLHSVIKGNDSFEFLTRRYLPVHHHEVRFRSQATLQWICYGKGGTGTGFAQKNLIFTVFSISAAALQNGIAPEQLTALPNIPLLVIKEVRRVAVK